MDRTRRRDIGQAPTSRALTGGRLAGRRARAIDDVLRLTFQHQRAGRIDVAEVGMLDRLGDAPRLRLPTVENGAHHGA